MIIYDKHKSEEDELIVFASDYDGTLYKNREITDYDLEAIKAFREAGNLFGIVTGRTVHSIKREIERNNIPVDFIVGINGGIVLSTKQEELFSSDMNENIIPKVMESVNECGVLFYGVNDGYRMGRVHVEEEDTETEFNIPLTPVDELMKSGVRALYVRCVDQNHAEEVSEHINKEFEHNGIKAYPNKWSVDVGVQGVTKATGIRHILDDLGINYDDKVYTIGDAYNDVSMIEAFNGFVMDNADPFIQDMGIEVVQSVGQALNQLMKTDK